MCDDSWLNIEENHTNGYNPFAWGHLINHKNASNVMYFEYRYPEDMPDHYKAYVPNIYYNGSHHMVSPTWFFSPLSLSLSNIAALYIAFTSQVKTIVLLATRTIEDEELFAHYDFVGHG